MSKARAPLRKIVVVGAGQVGAIVAIALKRALPACDITIIGTTPDPAAFADNAATALAFTNKLHDRLGISETQMITAAGASHRLVMRYFGWAETGSHGAMSYGTPSDPAMQSAFARNWGGGSKGSTRQPQMQSVAQALADAGRFIRPPNDAHTPISDIDYGLRWNAPAYRQLLVSIAQQLSIGHAPGDVAGVTLDESGSVASIEITGHGAIAADLFIDCGGPQAPLLSRLPGHATQDWSDHLPIRRVHLAAPGQPMLALEDRISFLGQGWLGECAGRDGLQSTLASIGGLDDTAIVSALGSAPALSIDCAPQRCEAPWIANVIAIGDAAARFEPLAGLPLDLAHRQLSLLLEMLPGQLIEPLERNEYNRRAVLMMDGVRDTLSMHYSAPHAAHLFDLERSDHVILSLDQFTRRGRLPLWEEAPFSASETMGLMGALGIAAGTPPQFATMGSGQIAAMRQGAEKLASDALEFVPPYQQWMAQMLGQRS